MAFYSDYTDKELVSLLREGDKVAFTEIYNRYWRIMYGHVYKMLLDKEEAKDVIQEIFSSVWLKSNTFPDDFNLPGYLYTSAKNRVLNLIRKHKFQDTYLSSLSRFIEENSTITMDQLNTKDLAEAIEREIQNLPPQMRCIFELSRKENLSHKEIAQKLGISVETVKKQTHNAIKKMRIGLKGVTGTFSFIFILYLSYLFFSLLHF